MYTTRAVAGDAKIRLKYMNKKVLRSTTAVRTVSR